MIVLDYQDRRPLYEQVTEKFRTLIYQGALPADSRLPSVRQLAIELSVNPNTIQRAYMTLEQEGQPRFTSSRNSQRISRTGKARLSKWI